MDMKVAISLISKAIYYYSMTGNTKALIQECNVEGYDIYNLSFTKPKNLDFNKYDVILLGTSTVGRGVPHSYFKYIYPQLIELNNKKIGLFGSGNSIYDVYCGALDVLEELLSAKNKIIFNYKFESYPTERAIKEFQILIDTV